MKRFIKINKYGDLYVDRILFESYFPIILLVEMPVTIYLFVYVVKIIEKDVNGWSEKQINQVLSKC